MSSFHHKITPFPSVKKSDASVRMPELAVVIREAGERVGLYETQRDQVKVWVFNPETPQPHYLAQHQSRFLMSGYKWDGVEGRFKMEWIHVYLWRIHVVAQWKLT